jgi:hypothetical protein
MSTHGKRGFGVGNLFYKTRIVAKTLFTYLFYLPGLVLHEASHALAALLTGSKITSIKLFPSIDFAPDKSGYSVTYGYVQSIARFRAAYMIIGVAPFFLWLIPLWTMGAKGWVTLDPLGINISEMFQLGNAWFLALLAQIAWAGSPSSQDWRVFFFGLFSASGFALIAAIGVGYFYWEPYLSIVSALLFDLIAIFLNRIA